MKIINVKSFDDVKCEDELVIAHGFFDGVHLAHQTLIREAVSYAKSEKIKSAVVTFNYKYQKTKDPKEYMEHLNISSLKRKCELFEYFGVDYVFIIDFNYFRHLTASEYVENVIIPLNTKHFIMGSDNKFGLNGEGNANNIQLLSNNAFTINILDLIKINGTKISSTHIKHLIENDDVSKANELLGYYYKLSGTVQVGKQLGKSLSFPTANLKVDDLVIFPRIGAYATITKVDNVLYQSMTNVGFNPTVDFLESLNIETHIFNFNEELYGENIEVYFVFRMRDEIKFSSMELLIEQLNADKVNAKNLLKNIEDKMII